MAPPHPDQDGPSKPYLVIYITSSPLPAKHAHLCRNFETQYMYPHFRLTSDHPLNHPLALTIQTPLNRCLPTQYILPLIFKTALQHLGTLTLTLDSPGSPPKPGLVLIALSGPQCWPPSQFLFVPLLCCCPHFTQNSWILTHWLLLCQPLSHLPTTRLHSSLHTLMKCMLWWVPSTLLFPSLLPFCSQRWLVEKTFANVCKIPLSVNLLLNPYCGCGPFHSFGWICESHLYLR